MKIDKSIIAKVTLTEIKLLQISQHNMLLTIFLRLLGNCPSRTDT